MISCITLTLLMKSRSTGDSVKIASCVLKHPTRLKRGENTYFRSER